MRGRGVRPTRRSAPGENRRHHGGVPSPLRRGTAPQAPGSAPSPARLDAGSLSGGLPLPRDRQSWDAVSSEPDSLRGAGDMPRPSLSPSPRPRGPEGGLIVRVAEAAGSARVRRWGPGGDMGKRPVEWSWVEGVARLLGGLWKPVFPLLPPPLGVPRSRCRSLSVTAAPAPGDPCLGGLERRSFYSQ